MIMFLVPVTGKASGHKELSITVRSSSITAGKMIKLADIADIKGRGKFLEKIEALEITRAPRPGKKRRIQGSVIASKLENAFPLLGKTAQVYIPEAIVVERRSQVISESALKKLFHDYIAGRARGRTFKISEFRIKGGRHYALGPVRFMVDERGQTDIKGRVTLSITVKVPSEKDGRIYLSGWVDVFDWIVCVNRDVSRGEFIGRGDLCLKEINLSRIPDGVLYRVEDGIGNLARTNIEKGRYLRDVLIEKPPLVRKGETVKMFIRSGLLTVTSTGISREDGTLGDQITVENARSGKNVTARVVDKRTVEILF